MSLVYKNLNMTSQRVQHPMNKTPFVAYVNSPSCAILDHCLTLSNGNTFVIIHYLIEKRITLFLFVIPFKIPTLAMIFYVFGVYRPTREYFTHMETSALPVKGYARHSWPVSNEGSLACHSFCDTRNSLIMAISEDP